jgi:hypothetical protein
MLTTRGGFDLLIDERSKPPHFRTCKGLISLIFVQRIQQIIQCIQ